MRQLALLVLLALAGCARKLPGPEECRAYALASVLGTPSELPAVALERAPHLALLAEERTRLCLTTPYDYELLTCSQTGRRLERCLGAFEQRRLLRGARIQ